MSDYSDALARLTEALTVRTHAVSVPAFRATRRKVTDTPPPNGLAEGYGTRKNTNANRRNGGGGLYYKPRAADFAGDIPATMRPSAEGRVKPTTGRKISGAATVTKNGKRRPSEAILKAKADSDSEGMRTEVSAQASFARSVGELPIPGIAYGRGSKPHGHCETLAEREERLAEEQAARAVPSWVRGKRA